MLVVKVAVSWPLPLSGRRADDGSVVVEGHRSGGAGDGVTARADDSYRGREGDRWPNTDGLTEVTPCRWYSPC